MIHYEIPTKCESCGSKNISLAYDTYDYDGNENVHTYDHYRCDDCSAETVVATNDPYANEEDYF